MLLVGIPSDFPPDAKVLLQINYLNGQPAIKIAENKWETLNLIKK